MHYSGVRPWFRAEPGKHEWAGVVVSDSRIGRFSQQPRCLRSIAATIFVHIPLSLGHSVMAATAVDAEGSTASHEKIVMTADSCSDYVAEFRIHLPVTNGFRD
jgi:hypothetical protein